MTLEEAILKAQEFRRNNLDTRDGMFMHKVFDKYMAGYDFLSYAPEFTAKYLENAVLVSKSALEILGVDAPQQEIDYFVYRAKK